MRRRDFITLVGSVTLAMPSVAQERVRRIGVLIGYAESDPEGQASFAAFREALQKLGWAEGRNIRIDSRWALDAELTQRFANEVY